MPVEWDQFEAVDAPKSDVPWGDFEAVEPTVKRNKLGESKEDLAWQMQNARAEGKLGNFATDAITGLQNTAEVGADPIGSFSRLVSPVFNKLAGQTVASDYNEVPMQGVLDTPLMMAEDALQLPRGYFKDESNPVKGITDSIENTATGLTNRKALPVIPLFGPEAGVVSPIASTVGKVLLGGEMAHGTTEAARNFGNVVADPDSTMADKANALTGAGTAFAMTGATAGHALPKVSDVPIPDFSGRDLAIPEGFRNPEPAPAPKAPKAAVPETPAEPQKGMTALEEIRNAGAKTKEDIRKLYPQLTREQAAQLRNQAWGEPAAPIVPPEAPAAAAPIEPEPVTPPPATNEQLASEAKQGKFAVTPEAESLIQEILGQPSRDSRDVGATKAPEPAISDKLYKELPSTPKGLPQREAITPAEDTPIGVNDAGDKLYQRSNGSIYRMRNDRPTDRPHGYPDFGGDLAPKEPSAVAEPAAPEAPAAPVAPEPVPEVKAPEAPKQDIESMLTADKTDVEAARSRTQAIDQRQADLREEIKKLDPEIKALEQLIKPQKGNAYTRSKIKASAKKADVAKWRELQKQQNDLGAQIQALDDAAKADRRAIDDSVDAEIISDKTQTLLRRLDRKVRVMGEAAPKELVAARDAEVERVIKEKYPDATPEEIKQMQGDLTRAAYFSNKADVWREYGNLGGRNPHLMRRQAIDAALNGPTVPRHLLPNELIERIRKFTKGNRTYGEGLAPDAPIEDPTAKETKDIVSDIQSHSERIHKEQAIEAERHAAEVKAEEAKSEQMMTEAQQMADSAPKTGTKGGRSAQEVRTELVSRIKGAIDDLIDKNKTTVTQEEGGRFVAVTEDKAVMAWGDIEPSGKTSFKVSVTRPGSKPKSFTVKSMEEAQWVVKAMASDGLGKAVIGIPGDGVFRLNKNGDTLLKLWNDAKRIDVSAGEGTEVSRGGASEKPPSVIKTGQDWQDAKEYHGLTDDDKIYDWSPALRAFAEKVAPEKPEALTVKGVDDWIESRQKKSPAPPVSETPNPSAIDKAEQWANDKLKGGGTSSGPDVLAAYAVKGAITIARGIKDFGEWSAAMLKDLGEAVRPHLQDIWNKVGGTSEAVRKFTDDILNPDLTINNNHSNAAGLGVKSIADLDAIAAIRDKLNSTKDELFKAAENDPSKRNQAFTMGMRMQYPREAVEVATNIGGWVEGGGSLKTKLGPRPLDWHNNPEVQAWLRKNADRLKISLPDDFPKEPGSAGLGKNVRNVSGATGEGGFLGVDMAKLAKKFNEGKDATVDFTKQVTKETMGGKKMNDLRKSVLDWSAKLQRSFGEAAAMQKDLLEKVPDQKARQGIVNWIQADGDVRVLGQRLAATADPKLAAGYRAALALTPEQIRVANQVKSQYADTGRIANHYDLLNTFKDNYITQLWDLKKGPTGGSSSRTLRDKFRFAKASTFPTYFDGEQAGFTPKGDKDIAKILPVYMHEMNTVIAARQLVEQMWKGKASDGRPLLAPIGAGMPVENASGHATLIMPKAMKEKTSDYKVIPNQPALSAWRWAATDSDGRPVMLKADLAVHPEAVGRLKAILGRSAIREWYDTPTSATAAIPKAIAKGLDQFQSTTKRTMLGLISPFHQVQEGTHAVGHRVNPFFGIPKIDLVNNRSQMDAARHGLMLLPDRASEGQFMEGLRPSGLVSRIPGIGPVADHYSNYLFHEYIPGLKFKTYSAILDRNNGVYAKDLRSGSVTSADIKVLSAEQTNAAFGHLNYADLARNPTIQHLLQLGLLAPDFLEARARFTGQGIKGLLGGKAGREQILALGTLAVAQATLAYTSAQLTGGQWDKTDPFSFKLGNRRYTMRSVPEDITSAMKDSRGFIYSRINPITMKGPVQALTGTDYRGKKVSLGDTAKELAQTPIPISVKGFLGIGNTSVKAWESLAGAVGLKISRDTTSNDVHKMALDWMSKSTSPKVIQAYKDQQQRSLPESIYKPLKMSVEVGDNAKIVQSVKDLLAVEPDQKARDKRKKEILREFNPFTKSPNSYDVKIKPFATRDKVFESAFIKSLDAAGKESYRQSVRDQVKAYRTLTQALYNKASDPKDTPEAYRTR